MADEKHIAPEAPTLALIARPVAAYTVHCSHCGEPVRGESGDPSWFPDRVLTEPERWPFEDDDWELNVDGRALVCPTCLHDGWCEVCSEPVHAWQAREPLEPEPDDAQQYLRHSTCSPS